MRNNTEDDGIHDYRICFGGDMYNTYSSLTLVSRSTCQISEHKYLSNYDENNIVNQFILQNDSTWAGIDELRRRNSIWKKPD
jgi:hypothetical protein